MQLAKIIGYADTITEINDLYGVRLLVAVPVDVKTMEENGEPFLLADKLDAQYGQIAIYAAANGQGSVQFNQVVAIPGVFSVDGEERLSQLEELSEEEMPTADVEEKEYTFDPVSDLTAEFKALHQELDKLTDEEVVETTTNAVPYEEYAKYLTTEIEPIDVSDTADQKEEEIEKEGNEEEAKKKPFSRVGYRSNKNK